MSKKIIKLSSNQVLKQVFSNSQIANKNAEPLTCMHNHNSLCGHEKPCGLFNTCEESGNSKADDLLFEDLFSPDIFDESFISNNNIENELILNENINPQLSIEQKPPVKKVSKFAKKVNDLNMKINIPSRQFLTSSGSINSIDNLIQPPVSPKAEELNQVTPDTEKIYQKFIESIPTAQLQVGETPLSMFSGTEVDFENLILGYTSTLNNDVNLNKTSEAEQSLKLEEISLDHQYEKKRKLSDNCFEESMTNDSFSSSLNSSCAKRPKNTRPRGIYRADDITNESDLQNYIERRKKNNISSKVSRANKKNAYKQMDCKCTELERDNIRLRNKIDNLEKLTKTIREYLLEKFSKQP